MGALRPGRASPDGGVVAGGEGVLQEVERHALGHERPARQVGLLGRRRRVVERREPQRQHVVLGVEAGGVDLGGRKQDAVEVPVQGLLLLHRGRGGRGSGRCCPRPGSGTAGSTYCMARWDRLQTSSCWAGLSDFASRSLVRAATQTTFTAHGSLETSAQSSSAEQEWSAASAGKEAKSTQTRPSRRTWWSAADRRVDELRADLLAADPLRLDPHGVEGLALPGREVVHRGGRDVPVLRPDPGKAVEGVVATSPAATSDAAAPREKEQFMVASYQKRTAPIQRGHERVRAGRWSA